MSNIVSNHCDKNYVWHDSRIAVIVTTVNIQFSVTAGSPQPRNQFNFWLKFFSDMVSGLGELYSNRTPFLGGKYTGNI